MSFNGNFAISQGADVTSLILTDTSTGSDTNLTDRHVTLWKNDGTTLVPTGTTTSYIDWPLSAGSTITITGVLAKDFAINIEVDWISSSPLPSPSTYTLTTLKSFTGNSETFYGSLTQMQATNPLLVDDNRWFENKSKLRGFIDDAVQAVQYMNNIVLAQLSLDDAYNIIQNAATIFQLQQ